MGEANLSSDSTLHCGYKRRRLGHRRLIEEKCDERSYGVRTRLLRVCVVLALAVGMSSSASAITFGEPDVNNQYPNVASVRGIAAARQNLARISCSGSLLHRDAQKVVILEGRI
ncbi:MAG: hypothetical protein ABWX62_00505 [Microterricola sp.]